MGVHQGAPRLASFCDEASTRRMDMDVRMTAASPEAARMAASGSHVRLVTIPVAAKLLGVSRSKLYELLGEGALPTVRIGRSRRIAIAYLEAFVGRCRDLG
jgi:excisionase family DNA binding protein